MRVYDGDELSFTFGKRLAHLFGVVKSKWVPCEVFLAIRVFNVKPDNIVWDLEFVELLVNVNDIVVGDIVPAALVVGDGEFLWQLSITSQFAVRLNNIFWSWAEEHKDVQL